MLVHPLFSLRYRMDPHIPRFHRFLFLFTRINILFAVSFFLLRELPNPDTTNSLITLIIFTVVGSLILLPFPIAIYSPFKTRYFLLKPKGDNEGKE